MGPHFPEHKDLGLLKVVPNILCRTLPQGTRALAGTAVWAAHLRGCMAPDCRALLSMGFTCDSFLCWSGGLRENKAQ